LFLAIARVLITHPSIEQSTVALQEMQRIQDGAEIRAFAAQLGELHPLQEQKDEPKTDKDI
jgi:hypothetical protein